MELTNQTTPAPVSGIHWNMEDSMKNRMRKAMALLVSVAFAASLAVTSVPASVYAAEDDDWDQEEYWDDDYDDDWGDTYDPWYNDGGSDSGSSDSGSSGGGSSDSGSAQNTSGSLVLPSSIMLTKGQSRGVNIGVYANASYWRTEWSVSGGAASISGSAGDTANLYGVRAGTSQVNVSLYDGNNKLLDAGVFYVYVTDPTPSVVRVTGVSVNVNNMTLSAGDSAVIRATVYPLNATNKDINWSTSNSDVVSVDGDGVVRARRNGSAVIYARSADTGATATCSITVKNRDGRVPVTGFAVDNHNVSVKAGTTYSVNPRVTPSNATNQGYIASTSNANVAVVGSGGLIIAQNNGTCVITYRSNEGDHQSQVTVNVYGATNQQTVTTQTIGQATQNKAATTTAAAGHDPNVQFGYLQKIAAAASGSTVILHTSAPSAYDINVLNAIKARPDVKVIAEFPFQGYEFHMYFPATFDAASLTVGGYVDWLTLCNYNGKGVTVSQIGAAQP